MCKLGLFLTAISTAAWLVRPPVESWACAGRVSTKQSVSPASVCRGLLMSERLDGIQLRRFAGRQIAEKYTDERRKSERERHDFGWDHERQGQRTGRKERADQPEKDADDAAEGR